MGSAEQAREVFPEDQIQLIGIKARIFDDLADLRNRTAMAGGPQSRERFASLLWHPIAGAARPVRIPISVVSKI